MTRLARIIPLVLVGMVVVRAASAEAPHRTLAAQVLRVTDGDTFQSEVEVWPDTFVRTAIRIRGMDAPEVFHPRCPAEKVKALAATAALAALIGAKRVYLTNYGFDKYGGRVNAVVQLPSGEEVAAHQIGAGHAQAWSGTGPKPTWCGASPVPSP